MEKKIDELFQMLKASRRAVAFTGAGISTLSGIRDFRGKNGLYRQPGTQEMFDIDLFYRDPSVYYRMAKDFIYNLEEKEPNVVHRVLARLEEKGILRAVITQNIDLLHQKAGSRHVIEVHGSPRTHRCLQCACTLPFEAVAAAAKTGAVVFCPDCGGVLKPEITFFGESLPQQAIAEAQAEAGNADLLLVLGSSLTVYPAASLPYLTLNGGGAVVIVNEQPTSIDDSARLCFKDLGVVFEALEERLNEEEAI